MNNAVRGARDEAVSRVFLFGEPIDSCHFELVHRRGPGPTTGTAISSQLLRSNRLYYNYDNTAARRGGGGGDRRPSSRRRRPLRLLSRSLLTFVLRTEGRSKLRRFLRSLRESLRDREREGPLVTQCASQNSYYIFDGQEVG